MLRTRFVTLILCLCFIHSDRIIKYYRIHAMFLKNLIRPIHTYKANRLYDKVMGDSLRRILRKTVKSLVFPTVKISSWRYDTIGLKTRLPENYRQTAVYNNWRRSVGRIFKLLSSLQRFRKNITDEHSKVYLYLYSFLHH